MTFPKKDKSLIDIGASAEGCNSIVEDILSIHAISGCDTVSPYRGISKIRALKTPTDKHISMVKNNSGSSRLDSEIVFIFLLRTTVC